MTGVLLCCVGCLSSEQGEGAHEGARERGSGEGGSLQQRPPLHLPHHLWYHPLLSLQQEHHSQGGPELSQYV